MFCSESEETRTVAVHGIVRESWKESHVACETWCVREGMRGEELAPTSWKGASIHWNKRYRHMAGKNVHKNKGILTVCSLLSLYIVWDDDLYLISVLIPKLYSKSGCPMTNCPNRWSRVGLRSRGQCMRKCHAVRNDEEVGRKQGTDQTERTRTAGVS